MQLTGFHHLTAVTANAAQNLRFYTGTLGMRLVKKTVNQDDVSAYHLFYADGQGSPGTDITFFDWPAAPERRGTNSVSRTGMRVASEASLRWWVRRLDEAGVKHGEVVERGGRLVADLEDPEGQRLCLAVDEGGPASQAWSKSPVPADHQLRGLGPITLSVPELAPTARVLTELMGMRHVGELARVGDAPVTHIYQMGGGGPSAELHVAVEPGIRRAGPGAGGVHHVAFRVPTAEEHAAWDEMLNSAGARTSGLIDRYYFRSLYFREPNGILFELATDGPGFASDEPMESLGERLSLPPFLEPRRAQIEAGLKPL